MRRSKAETGRVGTGRVGRRATALTAAVLVAGLLNALPIGAAITSQVTRAGAGAVADGCTLISAAELERVLTIPFDPQPPVGPSCLFLSAQGATSSIVTVFSEQRSASDIASGKQLQRRQPGARVLRGVGDLAVLATEPKTDPTGDDTLGLTVFKGNRFGALGITIAGETPTTKQMRRLGKILAKRL
jgi:hypothetical protein